MHRLIQFGIQSPDPMVSLTTPIMDYSSLIGSVGVILLLIAFFLNLFKFISQQSRAYILLNAIGAAISCYASLLIRFFPFVVLEAIWCLVALAALIRRRKSIHQ